MNNNQRQVAAKILFLLAISSEALSSELDALVDASNAIVNEIDSGIQLSGAALEYAYQGGYLTDGTVSSTVHISSEQLDSYNNALAGMSSYQPYGDVQEVLTLKAEQELELMSNAVDTFTEVVVDMIAVVEVAEIASDAATPDEQAEVQDYVSTNQKILTISQEQVDTYNQSVDDIETHANNASAYLGVAANEDAVAFLQTGAENNNSDANLATVTYDANRQWVKMAWEGTNNATAVYLNGTNYNMDFYVSGAEVLTAGSESELYLTGPTHLGYQCFMSGEGCNEG